jgi:hypothetical protein
MVGICGSYITEEKWRQMFWDEIRKHMLRAENNINMETVANTCKHGDGFNGFTVGIFWVVEQLLGSQERQSSIASVLKVGLIVRLLLSYLIANLLR